MKLASLLYHDVVGDEGFGASGFAGGDADIYKLTRDAFEAHVSAVSAVARPTAGSVEALLAEPVPRAVLFTFDDGGVGAFAHTAPLLETQGWRGIFFITTDRIGDRGFLDGPQLRELHARGHVLGSHSCSHPPRISHLPRSRLEAEWRDSAARLADLIGAPVHSASVPGGFYAPLVADAARAAGITTLFTSEPTDAIGRRGDMVILGRFSVMRGDSPSRAGDLAQGRRLPMLKQAVVWKAKKVVKAVGGNAWLAIRRRLLASR